MENVIYAAPQTVGSLPPIVNLQLYQGDDFFLVVTVDNSSSTIDLTGYTAQATIRLATGATSVLAAFVCTVRDATTLDLHLTSAESTKLDKACVWDLQIVDPAGVTTTLCAGSVSVSKQVTT